MDLLAYFTVTHAWIPLLLQVFALPLNSWRLYQMIVLIRNARDAIRGKPSLDWLKPFMSERRFRKGDLLFAKGETAQEMFYTMTGRHALVETRRHTPLCVRPEGPVHRYISRAPGEPRGYDRVKLRRPVRPGAERPNAG